MHFMKESNTEYKTAGIYILNSKVNFFLHLYSTLVFKSGQQNLTLQVLEQDLILH
jgi:hypothetical protein